MLQGMVVSWEDPANSADSISHYKIYVDDNLLDIYVPDQMTSAGEHSARLSTTFDIVRMHHVQVSAVNKADQEGRRSSHTSVLMNQCPPNIKPTGLKVLTASSRTSVILSVNCPENFDKTLMKISKCKVNGIANENPISREASYQIYSNTFRFEITDIEPCWNCRVAVIFSNEHGDGKLSDEILFQINSMKPSKPELLLIHRSNTTVKFQILTVINPGNVQEYHVYKKLGSDGMLEREPNPIIPEGIAPIIHEVTDLQPHKKYFFHVTAVSAIDNSTYESDVLKIKTSAQ